MKDKFWNMPSNRAKALMIAKRQLSELVCDAVNLEGIPFTLPEIQTLLEGITVGGHKISDQQIAINQANTWKTLFNLIETDKFMLTMEQICMLHKVAAKEEALEWGNFRSGDVTIAGTDYMPPPSKLLPQIFEKMLHETVSLSDIYDQAIHLFLTMARTQFFYDVNKRMGRFIMNGWLLKHGFPPINLPAKRQLEFNELMIDFYKTGKQEPMTHLSAFMPG